jgi:hypothetical protein
VASPKFESWWILWVWVCPWFILAPKCSNYALTNLLFGLCRSVWVSDFLSFFLVPSQSSNTPFYPQSAANQQACPNSLLSHCFHPILTFKFIKEFGSTSNKIHVQKLRANVSLGAISLWENIFPPLKTYSCLPNLVWSKSNILFTSLTMFFS